ncbi:phosphatidylinositide phosphatase SAC2 isoform X2 [Onthophagus taurus]|uniref:phosphatidylinositide phosphatase SAC2 isoform X2 n=1 Tax=Onthophagus taurus TaxID=166361 RepID=UPI000C1FFF86|nr:phosphatidylinositide phosphatase SAC2 isoform X2 [Onthophagus taurus]
MEVFRTPDFYIFVKGNNSLWWDRHTGLFIPKSAWELATLEDPVCLGVCDGLIGKVEHHPVFDARLLLIKDSVSVGYLHGTDEVLKIKSITFLKIGPENSDVNLQPCKKHNIGPTKKSSTQIAPLFDIPKTVSLSKTIGTLKNAGNAIKNTTQQAAAAMSVSSTLKRDIKDKERFEKSILEEFQKIFTDTDSFYYSYTCDITSSLQRLCTLEKSGEFNKEALWRTVNDKFFWNKYMLNELIELNNPLADPWILPIIQGYIQIEHCKVEVDNDYRGVKTSPKYEIFTLSIISRRSRYRAGTRYKRRGVDEDGECANYVETEQLIQYHHHEVSFVQVRGSVPVYWSQPGYKYRPPPKLDKDESETKIAFEKHFTNEIQTYGPVCIINLVDQSGKEKIIWDAYSHQIFQYNSPYLTYVTFDFHEYCRGMHFENVSILINSIADLLKDMNYCWRDRQGHICSQVGVFRTNCIDCLDRTNVVQTALGKAVMEMQFCKLGLITPDGNIPDTIKSTFQLLWANNGDIISKQYAGTNALKGDYTRTGERKLAGIMKDGMNSANRYYLSRFKDSTRQGTIDLMLGNPVTENILDEQRHQFEEDNLATAERVKWLIEDCKKMFINNPEFVQGTWGLINADPVVGDPSESEMDTILILTKDSYLVADYDDQVDKVTNYQRVPLSDITLIESGIPDYITSLFKSSKSHFSIRINYKVNDVIGYYHMFRSTNLRFFNNMIVLVRNEEEQIESLKAICEAFMVALEVAGINNVRYVQQKRLDRRKSKVYNESKTIRQMYLDVIGLPRLTRNVSETQLATLKNAGSKALTNMSHQFSKLNKFGPSFKKQPKFEIGHPKQNETSSESDEEYDDNIFQPKEVVGTACSSPYDAFPGFQNIEQGVEITEDSQIIDAKLTEVPDSHIPGVGILMGSSDAQSSSLEKKAKELSFDNSKQLISSNKTPEIHISEETEKRPTNLKLDRKLSHSSGEVENSEYVDQSYPEPISGYMGGECKFEKRSNSEQDITLNISQSQSESALKNKLTNLTSPVANVTKGLVSPLTKLAKGVQNLGANLDPRKMGVKHVTEKELEEHRMLLEKWKNSRTRLIAL